MAEVLGYILTLDAIITWAAASLVYKFALGKTQPKAGLYFRILMVTCSTFVLSLIFGNYEFFFVLGSQDVIFYIIVCAISGISVLVGDLFYFMSLDRIDASRAYPLTQLSLVFVYPFSFLFFGEEITISIVLGGILILSSVFLLSTKDKVDEEIDAETTMNPEKSKETLLIGILMAIGTAFFWAISIVSFNQARIISNDVFTTNFVRVLIGTMFFSVIALFKRDYFAAFKKDQKKQMKYYLYIGIAGALSLGLADTLFYMAADINGLVLTATITASTPMVQQILSIVILKEKVRIRFIIAVILIILGNLIIIFF